MPSRITIFSSCSCACCLLIFAKPTSSATLVEKTMGFCASCSVAYFSFRAVRKSVLPSCGRVGRMKDAEVGVLVLPGRSQCVGRCNRGKVLTLKVPDPLMLAVMLAACWVVPFDAQP